MLFETVRLALRSVRRNALRSFLTLLGIVIGVAAVIAMITIGSGTTEKVKQSISSLGSNLLVVRPAAPAARRHRLHPDNRSATATSTALRRELTGVKAISASSQTAVRVVYGAQNHQTQVVGTDTDYFVARDWNIAHRARLHRGRSAWRRQCLHRRRDGAPATCSAPATRKACCCASTR